MPPADVRRGARAARPGRVLDGASGRDRRVARARVRGLPRRGSARRGGDGRVPARGAERHAAVDGAGAGLGGEGGAARPRGPRMVGARVAPVDAGAAGVVPGRLRDGGRALRRRARVRRRERRSRPRRDEPARQGPRALPARSRRRGPRPARRVHGDGRRRRARPRDGRLRLLRHDRRVLEARRLRSRLRMDGVDPQVVRASVGARVPRRVSRAPRGAPAPARLAARGRGTGARSLRGASSLQPLLGPRSGPLRDR